MPLTRSDVLHSFSIGADARARLARRFYRAKYRAYADSLLELLRRHGERDRLRVRLSLEIREALEREAAAHAELVADTLERFARAEAKRRPELDPPALARHLDGYVRERARNRAAMIARQEGATARLDALVSFYLENGVEPEFDFAGPPPECEVCAKLRATQPHPLDVVLRIGHPHIGCRHRWRTRTRAVETLRAGGLRPGRLSAGRGAVAGIVGGAVFQNLHGSKDEALRQIEAIVG